MAVVWLGLGLGLGQGGGGICADSLFPSRTHVLYYYTPITQDLVPNAVYIFEVVACNRVGAGGAGDRLATRTLQPGEAHKQADREADR